MGFVCLNWDPAPDGRDCRSTGLMIGEGYRSWAYHFDMLIREEKVANVEKQGLGVDREMGGIKDWMGREEEEEGSLSGEEERRSGLRNFQNAKTCGLSFHQLRTLLCRGHQQSAIPVNSPCLIGFTSTCEVLSCLFILQLGRYCSFIAHCPRNVNMLDQQNRKTGTAESVMKEKQFCGKEL